VGGVGVTNYAAVLVANYPGSLWTLNGDTYEGLTWLSDTPKPTQQELDAAWPAVQQDRADAIAADAAAKQSAIDKLAALGLSVDEIRAAFGLEGN
jgi:exopolyphosphatase/pppGpp-phosphohydrolase